MVTLRMAMAMTMWKIDPPSSKLTSIPRAALRPPSPQNNVEKKSAKKTRLNNLPTNIVFGGDGGEEHVPNIEVSFEEGWGHTPL